MKNIVNYGKEPIIWANNRALERHRRSDLYSIPWWFTWSPSLLTQQRHFWRQIYHFKKPTIIITTYQYHFWRRVYHFEKPTISSRPTTFSKTTVTDGDTPITWRQPEPERTQRNSWKCTESTPKHYAKTNGTLRIPTKLIKTFSMKTLPTPNITRQPTEPAKTNGTHRNHIRTHGNLTNPPELIESNSIHTKQILENKQNLPVQHTSPWLGPRALDRQWQSAL